jgi:HK97 family phage prohead protease
MKHDDYIKSIDGAERRFFSGAVELREAGEEKFFVGRGIVFNSSTDLGPFTEEVSDVAADGVMDNDVRGAFNHSSDIILGRTKSGTMRLLKTPQGVDYEIKFNPNDPDHVRVMEKIKRGDVTGSSFAFRIKTNVWTKRDGKPHRQITALEEMLDIGPVTYPAYRDTTVAARSLQSFEDEIKNTDQAMSDHERMEMEFELTTKTKK